MKGDTLWVTYYDGNHSPLTHSIHQDRAAAEKAAEEARCLRPNVDYKVRAHVVATDFVPPEGDHPRHLYYVSKETIPSRPGCWDVMKVKVHKRRWALAPADPSDTVVFEYGRNYSSFYATFDPFRQNGRHYALISTDYTATAVVDLEAGKIIAREEPNKFGFCPTGFYVPDWTDVHGKPDPNELVGGPMWEEHDEHPRGLYGFVWGCVWGDDCSWKLQYLDLSRVSEGVVTRDDRFGYVELPDTSSVYKSPALNQDDMDPLYASPAFIQLLDYNRDKVVVSVPFDFSLSTGKLLDVPHFVREAKGVEP